MTYHGAFPSADRPFRWEGEEGHFRGPFNVGDHVRGQYGTSGVITAFNNTWSHLRAGRLVHIQPDRAPSPGQTFGFEVGVTVWERDLSAAEDGDVPAHVSHPGLNWRYVPASWTVRSEA